MGWRGRPPYLVFELTNYRSLESMLQNQYYLEYLLLAKHVQRSPWRWNLYLKDEEEAEEAEDQDNPDPNPKKKKRKKQSKKKRKKKLSDEAYNKIVVEESKDARQGNSHY